MKSIIPNIFRLKSAIILLSCFLITNSIIYTFIFVMTKLSHQYDVYYEPGYQFRMFKEHLAGVSKAGYVTDQTLSREDNDGAYLQAQYYLVPTIFELGSFQHEYYIIDSRDPEFIVSSIRQNPARRLANNEYGQALLIRKDL